MPNSLPNSRSTAQRNQRDSQARQTAMGTRLTKNAFRQNHAPHFALPKTTSKTWATPRRWQIHPWWNICQKQKTIKFLTQRRPTKIFHFVGAPPAGAIELAVYFQPAHRTLVRWAAVYFKPAASRLPRRLVGFPK